MQQCIFDRMYCDCPQNTIASISSKDLSTRVNINGPTTPYQKLGLSKNPRTTSNPFTKTPLTHSWENSSQTTMSLPLDRPNNSHSQLLNQTLFAQSNR